MPTPRETLLICFLGDPATGSADLPRVTVEAAGGPIEEVALRRDARQILRVLALPQDMSLAGPRARGSANRLADLLVSPPPQRRTADIAKALYLSRSQTDRHRRQLRRDLERQRLERHLHSEARGFLGLKDAITDVAVLFAAVRDERWDTAGRILRIVAPDDPQAAQLLPDDAWSEARAHIGDAIAQAKRHLPPPTPEAGPGVAGLPQHWQEGEEVLDGEIVDDGTGPIVLAGPRAIALWPRQRSRRRMLLGAFFLLLAAGALFGRHLLESNPPPSPLEIPAARAGPWPENGGELEESNLELANLTREIPFGAPLVVNPEDTLLMAVRLDVTKDSALRQQPFEINTSIEPENFTEDNLFVGFSGPSLPHDNSASIGINGMSPRERLELVPGSTVLLDDNGKPLRHLSGIEFGKPYYLPHLKEGQLYYVEWRLQAVEAPESASGQLSHSRGIECGFSQRKSSVNIEAETGDTLDCWLNLINWGARTLHDLHVHVSWNTVRAPDQLNIYSTASSDEASPSTVRFTDEFVNVKPLGTWATFVYVPGSTRLETGEGKVLSNLADLEGGSITLPSLKAGADQARRLAFELRVVSASAQAGSAAGGDLAARRTHAQRENFVLPVRS